MPELPFISIVTPCFNRVTMVAEAVESVLAQNYPHFEHIITDGGSTDGTLEVLKRYPHLRVYSEPDKNLYDALNKGIQHSRGEIIGHLNTDDLYAPDLFGEIAQVFAENKEIDLCYGGAALFELTPSGQRNITRQWTQQKELDIGVDQLSTGFAFTNARFYHRRFHEKLGLYDLRYRIGSDLDFMIRVAFANPKGVFVPRIICYYRSHHESLTFNTTNINPKLARDILSISRQYALDPRVPPRDRRHLARMHTNYSLGLFADAVRNGRLIEAGRCVVTGITVEPTWPVSFIRAAVKYAGRTPSGTSSTS